MQLDHRWAVQGHLSAGVIILRTSDFWSRSSNKISTFNKSSSIHLKEMDTICTTATETHTTLYLRMYSMWNPIWASPCEKGTYRIGEQLSLRLVCASAQSHKSIHCSLIQYIEVEASEKQAHIWPCWLAAHARLKDHWLHNTDVPLSLKGSLC